MGRVRKRRSRLRAARKRYNRPRNPQAAAPPRLVGEDVWVVSDRAGDAHRDEGMMGVPALAEYVGVTYLSAYRRVRELVDDPPGSGFTFLVGPNFRGRMLEREETRRLRMVLM